MLAANALLQPPAHHIKANDVADILRRSRREQGLPERVCDPSVIARLAVLVASASSGSQR